MTVMEKLTEIIRKVFDDNSIEIDRETTALDVDGWDSLSHVNLILAVENAFRIRFTQKELIKFRCVGDLHDAIQTKVAANAEE